MISNPISYLSQKSPNLAHKPILSNYSLSVLDSNTYRKTIFLIWAIYWIEILWIHPAFAKVGQHELYGPWMIYSSITRRNIALKSILKLPLDLDRSIFRLHQVPKFGLYSPRRIIFYQ
jgi:hypothetical protein